MSEPLVTSLLVLDTTPAGTLGGFNSFLIALRRPALETTHEPGRLLKGTLEITNRRLAEEVDLDQVGLDGALERDDGLDQERVGVLHV